MKQSMSSPLALVILGVALTTLPIPAQAAEEKESYKAETTVKTHDNGGYSTKAKEETTDAGGTTINKETTKDVTIGSEGGETKVKSTITKDPPGLLNKTTIETEDSTATKNGSVEASHVKKVDGKIVEEKKDKEKVNND
ncbi:MAG: hypothetical protein WDO70_12160 [Alphaproteobacteria bacterium]